MALVVKSVTAQEEITSRSRARRRLWSIASLRPVANVTSVASYIGDVRTHIFKINTGPKADMFKTIEENGKKSTFAKNFVTLDYACLSCYASRDKDWAAKGGKGFHK